MPESALLDGDPAAPRFGLPRSLHVPIAAASLDAIAEFVGEVVAQRLGRDARPLAVVARPSSHPPHEPGVPLWSSPIADDAEARLHGSSQVWVDVDYRAYRKAYLGFGLAVEAGEFLDHVQNRRAIRKRGRSHPWLRLSPVRSRVNSSGGSAFGGEGMENDYLESLEPQGLPPLAHRIIYADPMDLTKMLDIEPGTGILAGVRDTQALFYP